MKILAIETAHPPGSLALAEDAAVVAFRAISGPRRTTIEFAPLIQELLQSAGWTPQSVDLVATTSGPGSFTGTRIGVTAAKVFAFAANAQLVGVNTLELIASQVGASHSGTIAATLDAQRGQRFVGRYRVGQGEAAAAPLGDIQIMDPPAIPQLSADHFCGPGLERLPEEVLAALGSRALPGDHAPRADALARLAHSKAVAGHVTDPRTLVPNYYRKSAAEEKAAQRANP